MSLHGIRTIGRRYNDSQNVNIQKLKDKIMQYNMTSCYMFPIEKGYEDVQKYFLLLREVGNLANIGMPIDSTKDEDQIIDDLINFKDMETLVLIVEICKLKYDNIQKIVYFVASHSMKSFNTILLKIPNLQEEEIEFINSCTLISELKN